MNELTQEAVVNGNISIFDFMGCVHSKDTDMDNWEMSKLVYHSSWDALIPVCRKFDLLSENGLIPKEGLPTFEHLCDRLEDSITRTYEITPVFRRILDCIEWFNVKCAKPDSTTLNNTDNGK